MTLDQIRLFESSCDPHHEAALDRRMEEIETRAIEAQTAEEVGDGMPLTEQDILKMEARYFPPKKKLHEDEETF